MFSERSNFKSLVWKLLVQHLHRKAHYCMSNYCLSFNENFFATVFVSSSCLSPLPQLSSRHRSKPGDKIGKNKVVIHSTHNLAMRKRGRPVNLKVSLYLQYFWLRRKSKSRRSSPTLHSKSSIWPDQTNFFKREKSVGTSLLLICYQTLIFQNLPCFCWSVRRWTKKPKRGTALRAVRWRRASWRKPLKHNKEW